MGSLDRPKLRPLSGKRVIHQGQPYVALEDSLGLVSRSVLIPVETFHHLIRHFDGRTTLAELADRFGRETGRPSSSREVESLVSMLDQAMVLDGPTFAGLAADYARQPIRPSSLAGRSYPADPLELGRTLDRFYDGPGGAGRTKGQTGPIRAILSPHIDFGRGGRVYAHAYRSLVDGSDADVFVILGVAHQYCKNRFALTRKDFQTPLGTLRTDQTFVDHLAETAGPLFFEDELAHRTEHSIEFQVVFLQHALGERRNFSIVPILVGSFHDLMLDGTEPSSDPQVGTMIQALRSAERASGKKVAYIGGIDLCHVGPEFGDPSPVDDATLDRIQGFDRSMLDRAVAQDATGWFATAAEVENRWRVCGLAATYTLLETIGPARGRLLRYDQAVNPPRTCCVTFASVAFSQNRTG
jgi:AmmeMemoRadiSam system protein B